MSSIRKYFTISPGAVNPVRSQGICGSCYAYSVTGAMEGAYYIKVCQLKDDKALQC